METKTSSDVTVNVVAEDKTYIKKWKKKPVKVVPPKMVNGVTVDRLKARK